MNQLKGRILDFSQQSWQLKDILPSVFEKQLSTKGYGEFLFYREKYQSGLPRRLNPDFVLTKYSGSDLFLLVQPSFGQGDPTLALEPLAAILGLISYQIRVIISTENLHPDFYQVALQKGLLLVTVSKADFAMIKKSVEQIGTIDLLKQEIQLEEVILPFDIDPVAKAFLLQGQDLIDYTLQFQDALAQYEANYHSFDE